MKDRLMVIDDCYQSLFTHQFPFSQSSRVYSRLWNGEKKNPIPVKIHG